MDVEQAAVHVQSVARRYLARLRVIDLLRQFWEKSYDPRRKRYYYFDTRTGLSQWKKPRLLWSNDILDLAPVYEPPHAALLIQRQWRMWSSRLRVALWYGSVVQQLLDEQSGCEYWYNPQSGRVAWELPAFVSTMMKTRAFRVARGEMVTPRFRTINLLEHNKTFDGDDDGDDDGLDLDAVHLRRERKQPRSKMQLVVDCLEDAGNKMSKLDLKGFNAPRISSRVWDCSHLLALDLSHNRLEFVPEDIVELSKLQQLDLSHNQLREAPEELAELTSLQTLSLSDNQIVAYPANLYCLTNLMSFDISHNMIQQIACEVGNLELLKLTQQWEVGIGLLQKLRDFNASHNNLSKFPLQIETCASLRTLNLAHNRLKLIPELADGFQSLHHFDLSHNEIEDFVVQIDRFTHLRVLELNHNRLSKLPTTNPEGFASVQELNMASNQLSMLPSDIARWTALTSLDASHNMLDDISGAIGELKSLKILDLSFNRLTKLPTGLRENFKLEQLNLSHNCLQAFPSDLGHTIVKLAVVNLSDNELQTIPTGISTFSALATLNVSNNKLESVAAEIADLSAITSLDFSKNKLTSMPELRPRKCRNLSYLNLCQNQLSNLPIGYFMLRKLTLLDLRFNRIESLHPDLSEARQLRRLYIQGNKLTQQPYSIFTAPALQHCDISLNPIESSTVAQHEVITAITAKIAQALDHLWTTAQEQVAAAQEHHHHTNELPVAISEYPSLQRIQKCQDQLSVALQSARQNRLDNDTIIAAELALLCCMLQKLRYIKQWIDSAVIHLRTHEYLAQQTARSTGSTARTDYSRSDCPCLITEDMVRQARKTRLDALEGTVDLLLTVGQLAELTTLSDSQFLFFHLGFATCLQALNRHERATQHLRLAIVRHHDLPSAHVALLRSQLACGQYKQAVQQARFVLETFPHRLTSELEEDVVRLQVAATEGNKLFDGTGCSSSALRRAFSLRNDDVWVMRRKTKAPVTAPTSFLQTSNQQQEHATRLCLQARHQLLQSRAALEARLNSSRPLSRHSDVALTSDSIQ